MTHPPQHHRHRPFLALWTLAVCATAAAFVLFLAMRSRSMHLGYELGRARSEQSRLREARRVLELEVASYQTPQRVEAVARALLGMAPPAPDRVIAIAPGAIADGGGGPDGPSARIRAAAAAAAASAAADAALPYRPRVTPPRTALRPGAENGARPGAENGARPGAEAGPRTGSDGAPKPGAEGASAP
ncbi:MAG: cell division protein FtsL [Polyangiaceae bacterium]|nr:cell division protein FtsL [Polyangiaceae bacterium]